MKAKHRAPESGPADSGQLKTEIEKLVHQVKLQNNFWHRLLLGLATGIGTAIGASVIATLVILVLSFILKVLGVELELPTLAY